MLNIAFHFLIIAVVDSPKILDIVIILLSYAVDGLTMLKKLWRTLSNFLSSVSETTLQLSGEQILSRGSVFLEYILKESVAEVL